MSSILKALRKVGEEKRIDQHAAPDLRLDQGLTPVESRPFLPLLTGIALGAVIVGLFFLWMQKDAEPVAKVIPSIAVSEIASIEEKAVDFTAPANIPFEKDVTDQSHKNLSESVRIQVVALPPEPLVVTEVIKAEPLPKSPVKKQQQTPVASLISKPAVVTQAPPITAATKMPELEDARLPKGVALLVTEIFHQQDNANSMAVVNDLPVMIGSHVDSAIVAEIRPDAVLFKIGGKAYAVAVAIP